MINVVAIGAPIATAPTAAVPAKASAGKDTENPKNKITLANNPPPAAPT